MQATTRKFSVTPNDIQHLAETIKIVSSFAADKSEKRLHLKGVHIRQVGENIFVTATNGRYLARATIKAAPGTVQEGPEEGIVVPSSEVGALKNNFTVNSGSAGFGCTFDTSCETEPRQCTWQVGPSVSSGLVITQRYVDVERVLLPKKKPSTNNNEHLPGLSFDPSYMAVIAKAFDALRKANKKQGSVTVWTSGDVSDPKLCAYNDTGKIELQVTLLGLRM